MRVYDDFSYCPARKTIAGCGGSPRALVSSLQRSLDTGRQSRGGKMINGKAAFFVACFNLVFRLTFDRLHRWVLVQVPLSLPKHRFCSIPIWKAYRQNKCLYTRSRLCGHRIYGLFGYMVNFCVVPISLSTIKLTIYPEFDLNFGYMVNF